MRMSPTDKASELSVVPAFSVPREGLFHSQLLYCPDKTGTAEPPLQRPVYSAAH